MATERFVRLPKEKQDSILRAAIREFAREPLEKVSINKIIREAEISRGSFYTYFEDKKDVLRYIFTSSVKEYQQFYRDCLIKNHGDFWDSMEDLMDYTLHSGFKHGLIEFFKNIMLNAGAEEMLKGFYEESEGDCNRIGRWSYKHVNKENMVIESFEDFSLLMDMAMSMMMVTLKNYCCNEITIEEAKTEYHKKLRILQYGVYR